MGSLHPRRRHDRDLPGEARVTVSTIFNFNSSNFFSGRGKKRFLSFVFLALFLALVRFLFAALLFFALTIFFSTTTLKHKNILSGILLIFYYVLMFFFGFCSQILYLFSLFFVLV